jgi:hypothetical protein
VLLICTANGSLLIGKSELLSHELDTKIFHNNPARFVGEVDGSGFASMVYEMLEMQF